MVPLKRKNFLQNADKKELVKYFTLVNRMAKKDKKYERMLKNDLKLIKQYGRYKDIFNKTGGSGSNPGKEKKPVSCPNRRLRNVNIKFTHNNNINSKSIKLGQVNIAIKNIEYEINGYTFTFISKQKNIKKYVKVNIKNNNNNNINTVLFYTSSSGLGIWRLFFEPPQQPIIKGRNYVTTNFIHDKLQKFLYENYDKIPDDKGDIKKDIIYSQEFIESFNINNIPQLQRKITTRKYDINENDKVVFDKFNKFNIGPRFGDVTIKCGELNKLFNMNNIKKYYKMMSKEMYVNFSIVDNSIEEITSYKVKFDDFYDRHSKLKGWEFDVTMKKINIESNLFEQIYIIIYLEYKITNDEKQFDEIPCGKEFNFNVKNEYRTIVNMIPQEKNKINEFGCFECYLDDIGAYVCKPIDYKTQLPIIGPQKYDEISYKCRPIGKEPGSDMARNEEYYFIGDLTETWPVKDLPSN